MASLNGVTIRNFKGFRGHEGEPLWQGSVYHNGRKLGFWSQDAHGGSDNYDFNSKLLDYPTLAWKSGLKGTKYYEYLDSDSFLGGILMQCILYIIVYLLWKNGMVMISTFKIFNMYNTSIILFNLLPIVPLDGSKLLVNVLSKYLSYRVSYVMMIVVSIIVSLLFFIYNVCVGINDLVMYGFLLFQIVKAIKEYKYVINKFYLERVIYDNYYDEIINGNVRVRDMKIGKYYYFYKNGRYYSEKEYLKTGKIL